MHGVAPGEADGGDGAEVDNDAVEFEAGRRDFRGESFGFDDGRKDAADGDVRRVLREDEAQGLFGHGREAAEVRDHALAVADFQVDAGEVVARVVEDVVVLGDFAEGFGKIFVVFDVEAGGDLLKLGAGELKQLLEAQLQLD